jgi:hypothetical protein
MATATKKREVDAAGRRKKAPNEPDGARFVDGEPTEMQEFYAEWLREHTGYDVDLRSTILASLLRGKFQKSPENQKRLADNKARREQEEIDRAERAEQREEKRAAKAAAKEAAAAKAKERAEKPKPAPKAKPAAKKPAAEAALAKKAAPAKKAAAKPAAKPAARRRPAKTEDF